MNKENKYRLSVYLSNIENIGNVLDVSEYLMNLRIVKDYQQTNKPIYILKFNLPTDVLSLMKNSMNYKFILNIEFLIGNESKFYRQDIILSPFNKSDFSLSEVQSNDKDLEVTNSTLEIVFECFETKHFHLNNTLNNFILKNVSLKDFILGLFVKSNLKYKNFNVERFDNDEVYSNIIVNDLTFYNSIRFLETTYGLYTDKAIVFADDDTLTIRNPSSKSEYKNTINLFENYDSVENPKVLNHGSYILDETDIVVTEPIKIVNNTSTILRNHFTKFNYVDESNEFIYKIEPEYIDFKAILNDYLDCEIPDKLGNFYNKYKNNRFSIDVFINNFLKNAITTNITLYNVDVSLFNINTYYNIVFQDNKNERYNGLWKNSMLNFSFERTSIDTFSSSIIISLDKVFGTS